MKARRLLSFIPLPNWLRAYSPEQLPDDLAAGFITAALLIPQGIAYAILAGLPAEVGLYASIVPPVVYALLGSSRTLSVGPVSVAALLVADALATGGTVRGGADYLVDAMLLAALSGVMLLAMAALRLGFLVNFISHPVLSGFTSGAAVLIILSQLDNLTGMGMPSTGSGFDMVGGALRQFSGLHFPTLLVGGSAFVALLLCKAPLVHGLRRLGMTVRRAALISRTGPLLVLVVLTMTVVLFDLHDHGVAIVERIPAGLPTFTLAFLNADRMLPLLAPAFLIALIGYVESVSVAKVLGYRRREKIDSDRELAALGGANLAAAFAGGMPVAGGFSRSMVNYAAGARTQLATIVAALLVALAALFFTSAFFYLPTAALAAIIILAVAPLFDWRGAMRTFRYDRADAAALLITFVGVVAIDIEVGLSLGVAIAIVVFLWRSSRPHLAVVGRLAGTEHYRNVERYQVTTWPELLLLRVDRSLFFANVNYVEDAVAHAAAAQPELKHLVIICSAVNAIDHSAVEALGQLSSNLRAAGITLHLAEVKGPVMDRLKRSKLIEQLAPGQVFLSTQAAVERLAGDSEQGKVNGEW
ncbi:MAG: sulfate permease [Cellvibrionaceae bacterium]